MLFNSLQFLFFFPIVVFIFFLVPQRFKWLHLLAASCIFYAAFIPAYLLILLFTIIVDYFAGIYIERSAGRSRKLFLIFSIVANIGILAVFKYYNFFIDNINGLIHLAGIKTNPLPFLNIILPIGLSFHTFQAMSYTIEVYRKNQKAEKHFGLYALYVMFFPQLVAGPIERPQNLLHQFRDKHSFNRQNLIDGLRLMCWGLFKKVVIADRLSIYVNTVYNNPSQYHYLNLVIATIFFSIQIYCDFSGYSDIAIGSAKLMGFDLMLNFNRPYFATNIQAFWKRWHISLSTWFRDYLYVGLGGNRVSNRRTYINVIIVFILSGFWHGANWTFIIWGALHALYITVYMLKQQWFKTNKPPAALANIVGVIFTFSIVSFAWIFFRANNVQDAFLIIKNIFSANKIHPFLMFLENANSPVDFGMTSVFISLVMIGYMFIIEKVYTPAFKELNRSDKMDIAFMAFTLSLIICFGVFHEASFIYFQF